jgi:hypothetical protein
MLGVKNNNYDITFKKGRKGETRKENNCDFSGDL